MENDVAGGGRKAYEKEDGYEGLIAQNWTFASLLDINMLLCGEGIYYSSTSFTKEK